MAVLMSSMTLSLLHITPDEWSIDVDKKPDLTVEERARQKETFEEYTTALRVAKGRVVPLAVAELLLGAAMIVFAQRAAVGRSWARHALVQLTAVHVALSLLEWRMTPDLRAPEDHFAIAYNNLDRAEVTEGAERASKLGRLALVVSVSAMTILGLSLPRSRTFYTAIDDAQLR